MSVCVGMVCVVVCRQAGENGVWQCRCENVCTVTKNLGGETGLLRAGGVVGGRCAVQAGRTGPGSIVAVFQ